MTTRSLGLRRHSSPPAPSTAPVIYADQVPTYGLGRGLPRRRIIPAAADRSTVEEPTPEVVAEHIQPVTESDAVIDGVDTAAPVTEKSASIRPDFFDWNGEQVPFVGHYTTKDGCRFFNAAPAFLFEDRAPVSNIH